MLSNGRRFKLPLWCVLLAVLVVTTTQPSFAQGVDESGADESGPDKAQLTKAPAVVAL